MSSDEEEQLSEEVEESEELSESEASDSDADSKKKKKKQQQQKARKSKKSSASSRKSSSKKRSRAASSDGEEEDNDDNEEEEENEDANGDEGEGEDEDEDDDIPLSELGGQSAKKKVKSENGKAISSSRKAAGGKELPPLKQLELAMNAHKWWEDEPQAGAARWRTLEHNGVMFPPAYKPHGVKLYYDGKPVNLTPEQEEVATLYAEMPLDGPQLGGPPAVVKTFNTNFFEDFREVLGKGHEIKVFEKLDFSRIRAHVEAERERRRNMSKEEKEAKKGETDALRMTFAFALVDGTLQKVGNTMVEPPGLFRGRGHHPKTGRLKRRVMPEQVTINVGEDSPVPPCPLPGHSWGAIVHKHDVTWLAFWKENINDGFKYVWLAASSGFKGQADMAKYEKARTLKKKIKVIRADYEKKLADREGETRQLGTAMWVIDRLALRVGNEKDDDEADTVGCCSLRVEHVLMDKAGGKLTLDFLGKDSMRHHQVYDVVDQYGEVGRKVLHNFESFTKGKSKEADVFDKLDVSQLNDHLKTLMPGLSAKVFRTMNASTTLQEQLPRKIDHLLSDQEKVRIYNDANRTVAILCNHQRTVTKAAEGNIEKLGAYLALLKEQLGELNDMLARRNKGKEVRVKPEDADKEEDAEEKKKTAHLFSRQPKPDDVARRIEAWEKKIKTTEVNFQMKDDNKAVALGTSKINYMDPRITVAWAKRNEVPIEKLFPTALCSKFPWSMSVHSEFTW
jgi:DNA topoisomerase-1